MSPMLLPATNRSFVVALEEIAATSGQWVLADTFDEDGGVIGREHDGDGLVVIFGVAVSGFGRVEADVTVMSRCGGGLAVRAGARW